MDTCGSADFTALTGPCVGFRNTYFLTLAIPKYLFVKFILCRYFCLNHEVAVLTTVDLGSVAVFVVLVVLGN